MLPRQFVISLLAATMALPSHVVAQHEVGHPPARERGATLTAPSQAAFAAIAEVVRVLEADPATDWSKVDIEALRQHLIDMDEVMMHAAVASKNVPRGIDATVTGSGRTAQSIQRMLVMHAAMLDENAAYRATVTPIANGVRFIATAKDSSNATAIARIRGLGVAGLLTEGDHHVRHHLAIARGEAHPHDK